MNTVEKVNALAEAFMKNSKYVSIYDNVLEKVADAMKKEGKNTFPRLKGQDNFDTDMIIKIELMACSINYCFWYGRSGMYPAEGGSNILYQVIRENVSTHSPFINEIEVYNIIRELAIRRFPMIEERKRHLHEARHVFVTKPFIGDRTASDMVEHLVKGSAGFASDMFLKRAVLFPIQLHRRLGLFEDDMMDLFVPSDYQVPKVLNEWGAINYHSSLKSSIDNNVLIPKGSLEECEIRSATIIACRKLSELTGWTPSEIDAWLWLRRKDFNGPHHLTITTDY